MSKIAFTNVEKARPPVGKPLVVHGDSEQFYFATLNPQWQYMGNGNPDHIMTGITHWAELPNIASKPVLDEEGNERVTGKQFKIADGHVDLPAPIYKVNPYVLLATRGDSAGLVMSSGTKKEILKTLKSFGTYYDDCIVDIRRYDMHLNDNTKV